MRQGGERRGFGAWLRSGIDVAVAGVLGMMTFQMIADAAAGKLPARLFAPALFVTIWSAHALVESALGRDRR